MLQKIILYLGGLPFIFTIAVATLSIILGDYFAKVYIKDQTTLNLFLIILFYISCGIFFLAALFKKELIYGTIVLEVFYLVAVLLMGFFIFGEKFNFYQSLGIVLSLVGITIMLFSE